jgi:hypothetical protein
MRPLYKNDIIRISKPITEIKQYSVYFLIHENDIIYVGYSIKPYNRISAHLADKKFDRYHILNFETQEDALATEQLYIKNFKPIYNINHNDAAQKVKIYKYQPPIIEQVVQQPITKITPCIRTPTIRVYRPNQ